MRKEVSYATDICRHREEALDLVDTKNSFLARGGRHAWQRFLRWFISWSFWRFNRYRLQQQRLRHWLFWAFSSICFCGQIPTKKREEKRRQRYNKNRKKNGHRVIRKTGGRNDEYTNTHNLSADCCYCCRNHWPTCKKQKRGQDNLRM